MRPKRTIVRHINRGNIRLEGANMVNTAKEYRKVIAGFYKFLNKKGKKKNLQYILQKKLDGEGTMCAPK